MRLSSPATMASRPKFILTARGLALALIIASASLLAITTILWGGMRSGTANEEFYASTFDGQVVFVWQHSGFGMSRWAVRNDLPSRDKSTLRMLPRYVDVPRNPSVTWTITWAYGTPFRWLYGSMDEPNFTEKSPATARRLLVVAQSKLRGRQRDLPAEMKGSIYVPIGVYWPALLANVMIYWAVALALIYSGSHLRRHLRRRQRRCTQCGYSLQGLTCKECPECGSDAQRAATPSSQKVSSRNAAPE